MTLLALSHAAGAAAATHRRAWGPTFTIGRTQADASAAFADRSTLATAGDHEGDSAVAWLNSHRRGTESIELAQRAQNGQLKQARTVYTHDGHLGAPSLAMDSGGQVTIAFTQFTPDFKSRQVMEMTPGLPGREGRATRISPPGSVAEAPDVAVAPDGVTTVVYQQDAPSPSGGLDGPGVPSQVMAAFSSGVYSLPGVAGEPRFGTPVAISTIDSRAGTGQSGSMAPLVAVPGNGSAVAEWLQGDGDAASQLGTLQTATAGADGTFGAPSPLGDATLTAAMSRPGFPNPVQLAVNLAGDVLALWPGDGLVADLADRGSASSVFSPPTTVSVDHGSGLAVGLAPDRAGLLVSATGDQHHSGQLSTIIYDPGQRNGLFTPGPVIRQYRPPETAHHLITPAVPSIAFLHSVPLVTWQELSFQPAGRTGKTAGPEVTLEYAVGGNVGRLGHGRVLLHRALPGTSDGPLRGAALIGGVNSQIYEIFVENGGQVLATAVNPAIFR